MKRKPTTPDKPGPPEKPQVEPYFDCRLSTHEVIILVFSIVVAMALQCAPVLRAGIAFPLIVLMAVICWLSPFTGMFYIACAQSLPFPETAPLNPAQLGVVTWLPVAILRYRGLRFRGIKYLALFLPYLLWMELLWEERIFSINSEYAKAVLYAVMGCQLVNESRGRHLKSLLGLSLGALMVTNAYWGAALGLPIQLSDWGGARQEFSRLGGARADSIMVWPPTLLGTFGVIGVAFSALTHPIGRQTRVLKWLAGIALVMSLPPLIATMSNAAYLGWVIMLIWTGILMAGLRRRGQLSLVAARGAHAVLVVFLLGIGMSYQFDVLKVRSRMHALKVTYQEQSEEFGLAASRTHDWYYSIKSIARNPVTGRAFATEPEEGTGGGRGASYFSHNVFLDAGRLSGVIGMTMLLIFFFYPLWYMLRRKQYDRHMPFMLAHFALALFWMVLSFPFYKTFWAFWILACIAMHSQPPKPAAAPKSVAAPVKAAAR